MHGRPRQTGPPDPERVKAAEQKGALYGQLMQEVLTRRAAHNHDEDSLALSARLLELNPEVYTAWNYRREALQPLLQGGGEPALAATQGELALGEKALQRNPKSYSTWHHRKWIVGQGFCSLERELTLVGRLLDVDERNFHAWGYRLFVVQLMGTPLERELQYSEHKINQNFSNYSAWHCRTTLLPKLYGAGSGMEGGSGGAAGVEQCSEEAHEGAAAPSIALPTQQQQQQQQQPVEGQQQAAKVEQGTQGSGGGSSLEGEQAAAATATGSAKAAAAAGAAGAAASSSAPGSSAAATAAVPWEVLDREFELVKQAFYTEPEDQSGWFYHRWLLGCSLARWEAALSGPAEAAEAEALLAAVGREQQMCEELLDIEPGAKWPLLTLTRLRELRLQVLQGAKQEAAATGRPSDAAAAAAAAAAAGEGAEASAAAGTAAAATLAAEAAAVQDGYERLKELDPMRRGYYEDAASGKAHVVARPQPPTSG